MKIAITGGDGFVGRELQKRKAIPIRFNILDKPALEYAIDQIKPDVIIHLAGLTNVDYCEANREKVFEVNCLGTNNIIDVADGKVGRIIYISTDHVFSGKNFFSYREHHDPNPVNWYGFTKMVSEKLFNMLAYSEHCVVRTSKLFNYDFLSGDRERLVNEGITKSKVIKRSFMYLPDFVDALLHLVNMDDMPSLIHIAGTLTISYYDFWRYYAVDSLLPIDKLYARGKYDDTMTPRPERGGLNTDEAKRLGIPLKSYAEGIGRMKKDEEINVSS